MVAILAITVIVGVSVGPSFIKWLVNRPAKI